ncbi:MAG: dinitrogenase iron-molybdenum cofactor biosynthesis protein [Desulfobacteraceae bacterium]|nr:MAG: dinitrogenase iron-molybdenum cofactor biosynthesis protein [Desulfobacteraceae bacterium]
MKIAVSSNGKDLNSLIDPRFGRCAYFIIAETDDMSFEAFDNESIALGGGAGIQSAQFVASKGAVVVITGNCGPNAVQALSAARVEIFLGQSGTVRESIEKYMKGDMKSASKPNVADHYGMGGGGAGMGRGMGRGLGMGGGMGMGGGRGMGRGIGGSGSKSSAQPNATQLSGEEELKNLKNLADEMRRQIEQIESRINTFEKK